MKGSSMKLNYVSTFSGKGQTVTFYQKEVFDFKDYVKKSFKTTTFEELRELPHGGSKVSHTSSYAKG